MELIDKKGKINKTTFKQIVKETSALKIEFGSTSIDSKAEQLLLDLFSQDIQDDKDFEVKIISADKEYLFTGKDFNWFLKADRLKDLSEHVYGYDVFSLNPEEIEEAKKKKAAEKIAAIKPNRALDMTRYHVATASMKDPENPEIKEFAGLKLDCIKWLNQQIVQNANLDNEVDMLICLDFDANEPDWKTLKELFDEGKIDIC